MQVTHHAVRQTDSDITRARRPRGAAGGLVISKSAAAYAFAESAPAYSSRPSSESVSGVGTPFSSQPFRL